MEGPRLWSRPSLLGVEVSSARFAHTSASFWAPAVSLHPQTGAVPKRDGDLGFVSGMLGWSPVTL